MAGTANAGPGIGRRLTGMAALWLSVTFVLYVGFWAVLLLGSPGVRWEGFVGVLRRSAPFYVPLLLIAMAVPATLHLIAPLRAAIWARLFLVLSLVLPAAYLWTIREQYLSETARGVHVEGVGLWNAFAYLSLIGLYGSVVSLAFAGVLSAREWRRGRGIARIPVGAAAAAVLLYVALPLSGFAPFFAWLYR